MIVFAFMVVHLVGVADACSCSDAGGRKHVVGCKLLPGYPAEPPLCITDLPGSFAPRWDAGSDLRTIVSQVRAAAADPSHLSPHQRVSLLSGCVQFRQVTAVYQDVWDMLDDLDEHTWVLQPRNPSRSALSRRIALSRQSSIQLLLEPGNAR